VLSERQKWGLVAGLAGAVGAFAVRHSLEAAWEAVVGEPPPKRPSALDVPWRSAIAWTMATGTLIGLGRLLALRGAAEVWERVRGDKPPL
jgi:hypothetical protein